ncbi:hypothetical protein [uncultured Tateyamaria sp.]|uniref:hypothetical protein n=1 Tax=uncultured Tateyamaria sp. TaxID=455651 RepID=UPI00260B9847|nr:hypothetical protein [uncultured Tateyamaria sp.]
MIQTETVQRARILSALGVATKQTAVSGNQDATVRLRAEEANAQAVVAAQNRQAVLDAQERYGDVGFNACAVVERSQAVATARANEAARMDDIQDLVVNRPNVAQDGQATEDWFDLMKSGSGTSSTAVFNGGTEAEVAQYIDWLMGPPQSNPGSAVGGVQRVDQLQRDAQRSVSQYLLMRASVSNSPDSVDAAIAELSGTWTGTDGGAEWAARLATAPLRAVLLDMSRAEAANLVSEIRALEHQLDLELGLAAFSMARSTKMFEISGSEAQ